MKVINVVVLIIIFLDRAPAQLKVVPIPVEDPISDVVRTKGSYRITANKLTIPIWEDFSTSSGHPDTALWVNSENVWVNQGLAIGPPSLNVATFDGLDRNGNPYSLDPADIGQTDSLVSKLIDLTQVASGKRNSVYLSFYYQKGGTGEPPDAQDMIELQFRTAQDEWIRVWPDDPQSLNGLTSVFKKISIQIADTLFHENFQFKFIATGRRIGSFDTWNLDYIYLDKNRSLNDFEILDRAITTVPNSIFKNYTAIPLRQLFAKDETIMDSTSVQLYNYEISEPVQGIEFSAIVRNLKNQAEIERIADKKALIIQADNFLELRAGKPTLQLLKDQVSGPDDSLYLEITYYADTGDTLLIDEINPATNDTTYISGIDLRANDTVRSTFTLHNYFAYDDGSAEFGAGVNQNKGQIAYKFFLEQPDTLVAFSIHFPNINGNVAGLPIELIVLKRLDGFTDSELLRQAITVQSNNIDEFKTYRLLEPLPVRDTIYIGFQQSTNEFIPVGLDKNTNSGNKIFYNVTGVWQANTDLSGSLLMRPVFGKGGLITATRDVFENSIKVFPNPSDGAFYVSGNPSQVNLYDLNGRRIPAIVSKNSRGILVTPVGFNQGVYLVELVSSNYRIIRKIILR